MIDYENKRLEQSLPDPAILSRQDYMISGFALLDDFFLKDDLNIDATLKEFSDLSILSLKTAFEWTHKHFAEFDMGSGIWLEIFRDVAYFKQFKNWNRKNEKKLISRIIKETRWYDENDYC